MSHAKKRKVLYAVALPILFVGVLQLAGCGRRTGTVIPPGGAYLSESAGARFEQSVVISEEDGEHFATYALREIHRPLHNSNSVYIAAGDKGIVVSHDDGRSWQVITTPLSNVVDVVALQSGALIASGTDAVGQGFVARSLDQGKSWQGVFTVPVPVDDNQVRIIGGSNVVPSVVISVEADPFNPDRIYGGSNLGTIFVGEQSAKVWRTLTEIRPDLPGLGPATDPRRFAIEKLMVSPHRPGELLLITANKRLVRIAGEEQAFIPVPEEVGGVTPFAVAREQDVLDAVYVPSFSEALLVGVKDGVLVTRDNGVTWVKLPVPVDTNEEFNSVLVSVSPTNINRLFAIFNNVVYRSEDGGQSWNTYALGVPRNYLIEDISINPANAARVLLITRPVQN